MAGADPDNLVPFGPSRVSFHAVVRYLQRIHSIRITELAKDPESCALAHCDAAGLSLDEVRALIWTPLVALAVERGFFHIGTTAFLAIASQQGTIVTICHPRHRDRRKLKLLSDREQTDRAHRINRRRRKT